MFCTKTSIDLAMKTIGNFTCSFSERSDIFVGFRLSHHVSPNVFLMMKTLFGNGAVEMRQIDGHVTRVSAFVFGMVDCEVDEIVVTIFELLFGIFVHFCVVWNVMDVVILSNGGGEEREKIYT